MIFPNGLQSRLNHFPINGDDFQVGKFSIASAVSTPFSIPRFRFTSQNTSSKVNAEVIACSSPCWIFLSKATALPQSSSVLRAVKMKTLAFR
jgi:hypothetical protein